MEDDGGFIYSQSESALALLLRRGLGWTAAATWNQTEMRCPGTCPSTWINL